MVALLVTLLIVAAPVLLSGDRKVGFFALIAASLVAITWFVIEAVTWANKEFKGPRPILSIHWVRNPMPFTMGSRYPLRVLAFYNEGDRIAENARIIPDRTKSYWLEQIASINSVPLDNQPHQILVVLRHRAPDGSEENVPEISQDPVTHLLMLFQLSTPPILESIISYEYTDSESRSYPGLCRLELGSQGVVCQNLPPKPIRNHPSTN